MVDGIRQRHIPALARAISLVENGRDGYEALLSALHPMVGKAHRIGITGPPGGGKSTLIEGLVQGYRAQDVKVAVVAVDPTSPFTGGALLGDRIRMESVTLDPGVYIRSMASRGGRGGLATTTREVCDVLDAFGFNRIIIETVGVGQSELAIAASADTTVLVLVPESGDGVQVLKAGVMEIADLYVVNKADRPGAEQLCQEVEIMLGFRKGNAYRHIAPHHGRNDSTTERGKERSPQADRRTAVPPYRRGGAEAEGEQWSPPVLTTSATTGEGVHALLAAIHAHFDHLETSGRLETLRRERLARHTREVVDRTLSNLVWQEREGEAILAAGLDDVVSGLVSPYKLAHDIVADLQEDSSV
ncbi:MAG: methylmalonyl Co-A mutase-associated GTPase MeaB [Gemmatimonadales bacterium]|nr:methylmalonyl Co-A mutase-associated GTPase MeaB [Gemmatimonadales bacterium]NIN12465.1 methylmalonyl Co-A mutase-associated GTPase MeaB [Gemmatimonadales bacterium]NIN50841.1 methylmalonyl Co-A mutase-associated GTPase MeaB [Gemmatimonadales bacterium]NIP08305.1 methylmalonyl Co-A mutase-associated GTPase MeaB [Gemmatimonadales bacterium]NIR00829.1 methylmalonyl Co-A mutase-associated GTPase MeaB [Gemmatimonadales bacterium]